MMISFLIKSVVTGSSLRGDYRPTLAMKVSRNLMFIDKWACGQKGLGNKLLKSLTRNSTHRLHYKEFERCLLPIELFIIWQIFACNIQAWEWPFKNNPENQERKSQSEVIAVIAQCCHVATGSLIHKMRTWKDEMAMCLSNALHL